MSLLYHAKLEFQAAGWVDENGKFKDDMQELICTQVLELLEKFSKHGHSGTSAPYAINLFSKLAKFEPIVPLTGEDWEWNDLSEMSGRPYFQNKRCSHVFKDSESFDGQAYDSNAVVYWSWWTDPETGEKSKSYFTKRESRRPITFPYTPVTVYEEDTEDESTEP